ncbi:hypothetical protein SLEP1_g25531 [Rubroshorea leprosula]|uniref:Transposase MuDR plant domain-containing protein n=1 Tax=Rubroshorea leprosula TaxID=152421 RepID=A0AAV5JTI9_9ROSI|nr:hypothetical protein SLEP1_g25531 [Rubroshorea leprosula]
MFVHVGGRLMQDDGLKYVDGKCNVFYVNPDKITVWEFYRKVELCRCDPDMVDEIWYLQLERTLEDGLVQIVNDDSVREVLEIIKVVNVIHICVLHVPNFAFVELVLPLPAPGDDQREENDNVGDNFQPNVTEESAGGETLDGVAANVNEERVGSNTTGPSTQHLNEDDEIGSDEEDSYISTSNEEGSEVENGKRRQVTHRVYQDLGDDGTLDIKLGMIFASKQQFRAIVDKWNLKDRRDIKWRKSDKLRCRAACVKALDCPWQILLAMDKPTESWMVKTFVSEHTCTWRLKNNKRCSSIVVAKYLVRQRGFTALYLKRNDIFKFIRKELSVELTHHQLKKVKEKIAKVFEGDCKMEYGKLWDYAAELKLTDPATTIIIEASRPTTDLNPVFLRMYICFFAMKLGFVAGCRRVIGVDGAYSFV